MRPRGWGVEDTGRPDWIRSEHKKVTAILRLRMVVDDKAARGHGHRQHFCVRRQSSAYLTPSMLSTRTFRSVGSTGPGICARAWLPASRCNVRRLTIIGRMANSHANE